MQKTVIITGGTGGLGRAVVNRFLGEGYHVIATLEAGAMLPPHDRLTTEVLDVLDEQACQDFISQTIARTGEVYACVMLVGGFAMGDIAHTPVADLEKMYRLNFLSAYHLVRPAIAQMSQQAGGGKIIFVGARPALQPEVGKIALAYSLSKSLLFELAHIINADSAQTKVTATVIVPSTIDTPANRASMPDADFAAWVQPQDIADVMAFVCSDAGATLREAVLKVYNNA